MDKQSAPRTRQSGIWIRLAIAYILGGFVAYAWVNHFRAGASNQEELSVALAGLGFLSLLLGVPALMLAWSAVNQARRLRKLNGGIVPVRVANMLGGLLLVLVVAGAFVAQSHINQEKHHVQDLATASMFDRSGLAAIRHRGHTYRNPNDTCLAPVSGATTSTQPCGSGHRAPIRTKQWLLSHHQWPLTSIGEVRFPNAGKPGPQWGMSGPTHQILRPSARENPTILLVSYGRSYLEYRRT